MIFNKKIVSSCKNRKIFVSKSADFRKKNRKIIMLRNNLVNYFEFCPAFDKNCLHFRKCDACAPPL